MPPVGPGRRRSDHHRWHRHLGRDSAYETISSRLDKRLDGFGELFRVLSYEEIGAAAKLSRAVGVSPPAGRCSPCPVRLRRSARASTIDPAPGGSPAHELTRHADRS
ncbi:MAG: hypothetical protein CM1200mP2_52280 [Planctomycetaceae bacterium]|nr:MAG: hypothetical protein CM1200mP2_52280 [Planctomycetaceae bacterium]